MGNETHTNKHFRRTLKVFIFCNYITLGTAACSVFLTLCLRLFPSLCGVSFILLHVLTVVGAMAGCAAGSSVSGSWFGVHVVSTVLTSIFQGSASVLIFTRTEEFLESINTYVREEDAAVILKLTGGLCFVTFCMEWVALTLALFLKYLAYVVGGGNANSVKGPSSKAVQDDDVKDWPWPLKV